MSPNGATHHHQPGAQPTTTTTTTTNLELAPLQLPLVLPSPHQQLTHGHASPPATTAAATTDTIGTANAPTSAATAAAAPPDKSSGLVTTKARVASEEDLIQALADEKAQHLAEARARAEHHHRVTHTTVVKHAPIRARVTAGTSLSAAPHHKHEPPQRDVNRRFEEPDISATTTTPSLLHHTASSKERHSSEHRHGNRGYCLFVLFDGGCLIGILSLHFFRCFLVSR
jgi:hypothetical protein